jgi:hypothetical protein
MMRVPTALGESATVAPAITQRTLLSFGGVSVAYPAETNAAAPWYCPNGVPLGYSGEIARLSQCLFGLLHDLLDLRVRDEQVECGIARIDHQDCYPAAPLAIAPALSEEIGPTPGLLVDNRNDRLILGKIHDCVKALYGQNVER